MRTTKSAVRAADKRAKLALGQILPQHRSIRQSEAGHRLHLGNASAPDHTGDDTRRTKRRARERRGRLSELVACGVLLLKGYRIVERRLKAPRGGAAGEIDIIAIRGNRLAFVEVKQRLTHDLALASITSAQTARIEAAAERWLWRHPNYRNHCISLDALLLDGWLRPRHVTAALHAW